MKSRQEIKALAKMQLGGNLFGSLWMIPLAMFLVMGAICGVLPGIGTLILTGPLTYGLAKAFLSRTRGAEGYKFEDLFSGFTDDFGGTFLIFLMTSIFTWLWSLLFVIPGIVKSYSYSMAYYIKNDCPQYDWNTCIKASMQLMNGHKWQLFVLDLSFIGWYIVGSLCLGIGTLWVAPYHLAAHSTFYTELCLAQNQANAQSQQYQNPQF